MWTLDTWPKHTDIATLDRHFMGLLEAGITTFDHADVYGQKQCQSIFGKWLGKHASVRSSLQLITKCNVVPTWTPAKFKHYDSSRDAIIRSVETSLASLQTDYIDLLLLHREDPLLDPLAVASAVDKLVTSGKIRSFGVSNFSTEKIELLNAILPEHIPISANQIELSLAAPESFFNGLVDACWQRKVAIQAWSPLGRGKHFEKDHDLVESMCRKYQCSTAQLWIRWLQTHPAKVSVVIGTSSLQHALALADIAQQPLERADWFGLLEHYRGQEVA